MELGARFLPATTVRRVLHDDVGRACGIEAVGPEGPLVIESDAVIVADGAAGGVGRTYCHRDDDIIRGLEHLFMEC